MDLRRAPHYFYHIVFGLIHLNTWIQVMWILRNISVVLLLLLGVERLHALNNGLSSSEIVVNDGNSFNPEEVEVFQEDINGKKNEEFFFFPYRPFHGFKRRYARQRPHYRYRNYQQAQPRREGANSKYPICSYEDTSFIGVENSILNSLPTESAYECKFDCKATKNCKFWTYDEEARRGNNNCFLIDLGIGRTPKDVYLDRDYVSGTRRNNCKCLRRTDFIEVDGGVESDSGTDPRRRRRRRRNRQKICPRGVQESDDIDYFYDDYEELNESLTKAANSTN